MSIRRRPARGICPHCKKTKAIRMTKAIAGTMRDHGPDCPGVGRPPVEPEAAPLLAAPLPAEETAVEPSTEPSAAVEPASVPVRYQEGDRVRSGGLLGSVEAVYGSTVEVTWDDGRVQTVDAATVNRVGRPEDEPAESDWRWVEVNESAAVERLLAAVAQPAAEVAPSPPAAQPVYTLLDEDDGAIDGGAVTLRAETSHADLPTGEPTPSLLGPAQRSRIEQLEAEAEEIEELRERAQRADAAAELQQVHQRRIRFLEGQLDASREEAATLRDELARARATLSQALALIGRLSPL